MYHAISYDIILIHMVSLCYAILLCIMSLYSLAYIVLAWARVGVGGNPATLYYTILHYLSLSLYIYIYIYIYIYVLNYDIL